MMRIIGGLWGAWFFYWWLASLGVHKPARTESRGSRAVHMGLLAAAFLLLFSPLFKFGYLGTRVIPESRALECAGVGMTCAGLLFAVWARVHLGRFWSGEVQIKQGHRLIESGPYSFVRNPIYTGFLLAIVGSALTLGEARGALIIAATLTAFARKIKMEETMLGSEFGAEFAEYKRRTKALIPFVY
jgi:protein-S-isoprenylcysteine O-methyltransferase Ste14